MISGIRTPACCSSVCLPTESDVVSASRARFHSKFAIHSRIPTFPISSLSPAISASCLRRFSRALFGSAALPFAHWTFQHVCFLRFVEFHLCGYSLVVVLPISLHRLRRWRGSILLLFFLTLFCLWFSFARSSWGFSSYCLVIRIIDFLLLRLRSSDTLLLSIANAFTFFCCFVQFALLMCFPDLRSELLAFLGRLYFSLLLFLYLQEPARPRVTFGGRSWPLRLLQRPLCAFVIIVAGAIWRFRDLDLLRWFFWHRCLFQFFAVFPFWGSHRWIILSLCVN